MLPIILEWGPVKIHSYGLMVALGFSCALFLAQRAREKSPLTHSRIADLSIICLVGGLVGGRLLYILLNGSYFQAHPLESIMIHKGGLAFFGALLGGFGAAMIAIRRWGLSVLETADFLIVYIPLAHAFGRIGCFLNGCCWGSESHLPWAVQLSFSGSHVHPVQLYAVVANLLLFLLLLKIRSNRIFQGQVLLSYGILYGLIRFMLELFRGDTPHSIFGYLTPFQLMAAALVCVSCAAWIPLKKRVSSVLSEYGT